MLLTMESISGHRDTHSCCSRFSCFSRSVPYLLLYLRPILLCALGRTSCFLRNAALINYPSCVHPSVNHVDFLPQEWNMLALLHPKKTKYSPLEPMCLLSTWLSPTVAVYLITSDKGRWPVDWLCICSLNDLLPFVPAWRDHFSPPTVIALSLQSPPRPLLPDLLWLSPEEQVNFGRSNIAFALLTWRYSEGRSFRRKVLIWRGAVFYSKEILLLYSEYSFFFVHSSLTCLAFTDISTSAQLVPVLCIICFLLLAIFKYIWKILRASMSSSLWSPHN